MLLSNLELIFFSSEWCCFFLSRNQTKKTLAQVAEVAQFSEMDNPKKHEQVSVLLLRFVCFVVEAWCWVLMVSILCFVWWIWGKGLGHIVSLWHTVAMSRMPKTWYPASHFYCLDDRIVQMRRSYLVAWGPYTRYLLSYVFLVCVAVIVMKYTQIIKK